VLSLPVPVTVGAALLARTSGASTSNPLVEEYSRLRRGARLDRAVRTWTKVETSRTALKGKGKRRVESVAVENSFRRSAAWLVVAVALAAVPSAWARPRLSPPVVQAGVSQVFTLVVEPDKGDVFATMVELYPPPDFRIDSFASSPEWHRDWTVQSGKHSVVQKAVWTREEVPKGGEELEDATEEDAMFSFVAHPEKEKTYEFEVRQTYSDGSVIHWTTGRRSVAFPSTPGATSRNDSPLLIAKSSLGGGGSSTISLGALAVGAAALVVALAGLVVRRRDRRLPL
jgi:hypothetical protein